MVEIINPVFVKDTKVTDDEKGNRKLINGT